MDRNNSVTCDFGQSFGAVGAGRPIRKTASEQSQLTLLPPATTAYRYNGSAQVMPLNASSTHSQAATMSAAHHDLRSTHADQPSLPASRSLPVPAALSYNSTSPMSADVDSDSDSDTDSQLTHPNKYPVEIEHHDNQHCVYRRQSTRSGQKVKPLKDSIYDPTSPSLISNTVQHVKYYEKHLVRVCRCAKYNQMDGALVHGRSNDCDGYEIHYSQKCKWKAYDDYKTGKRVLIRLCKCYKPMF